MAITLPLGALMLLGGMKGRHDLAHLDAVAYFVVLVIEAPLVETCFYQFLPILIMRWLGLPFSCQVGISMFLFWKDHAPASAITGICAGLIGGFYLGFTYAFWAQRSHWTAYWTTMISHAIGNAVSFFVVLVFGGFSEAPWAPDWLVYTIIIFGPIVYWHFLARDNAFHYEYETREPYSENLPEQSDGYS